MTQSSFVFKDERPYLHLRPAGDSHSMIPRTSNHPADSGGPMGLREILAEIDRELSQLKKARSMLQAKRTSPAPAPGKKRNITPEGRRRIAEAVKRRWALQKKRAS